MRLIDADALIQAINPMYVAKKDIVADTFAEGCMQFEKLIKQQPTVNQWIPVSERLPEDGEWVCVNCVYFDDEYRECGHWGGTIFTDPERSSCKYWEIL